MQLTGREVNRRVEHRVVLLREEDRRERVLGETDRVGKVVLLAVVKQER